jgi:hypothetical protein
MKLNQLRVETMEIHGKEKWDIVFSEIYKESEVKKVKFDDENNEEFTVNLIYNYYDAEYEVELTFWGCGVEIGSNYADICIDIYNRVQETLQQQMIGG